MSNQNLLYRSFFDSPMTIIRICLGVGFLLQGINVFSSGYMEGHIAMFESLYELPAPTILAYLSKGGELIVGILLIIGLFTRIAALFIIINMLVATFYVLGGDIFSTENYQAQISWFYVITAFAIFVSKPTAFSLDERMSNK